MAKKEAKANKKENNKNKKSFAKNFKAELKKVIWPTPKQLLNNTVAVLTIVLITAAIVFVLDLAFESLNKYGVNKVKEVVTSVNSTSSETTQNDESTTEETTSSEDNQEIETTVDADNSTESNVE
ncbi:MAG: preprotein translocase subunit SecE [Clostridia bacterium]